MSGPIDHLAWLEHWVESHHDELVAVRRHLHAHPEPSWEETETTAYLAQRLRVAGLEPRILTGSTGLVCDLRSPGLDGRGPIVALRADIDALAMDDEKPVSYRSLVPGVAHACGHDVHMAVVLGAGLALRDLFVDDLATGQVRLIFQPAEETMPGGALEVIAAGGLEDVEAIFGLHCDPKLEVGRVGLRAGAITSAADQFAITLHGPGGHTARPERTADLVAVAARIVTELPVRVRTRLDDPPLHLVFGMLHSGDAPNVIPTRAELRGTLRTPEPEAWADAEAAVRDELTSLVTGTGAELEVVYTRGMPPVVNNEESTDLLRRVALRALGPQAVTEALQSGGADDFAWYLHQVPGSYARLGVRPPGQGPGPDLHAGGFDVDERCLDAGVRLLVSATLEALRRSGC